MNGLFSIFSDGIETFCVKKRKISYEKNVTHKFKTTVEKMKKTLFPRSGETYRRIQIRCGTLCAAQLSDTIFHSFETGIANAISSSKWKVVGLPLANMKGRGLPLPNMKGGGPPLLNDGVRHCQTWKDEVRHCQTTGYSFHRVRTCFLELPDYIDIFCIDQHKIIEMSIFSYFLSPLGPYR